MSDNNRVKMELERALAQGELDHGQLLSIAHDLAAKEPDSIRFSVDASHISRLGIELVSKQETAISELIKNAYDADAVRVDVVFKDSGRIGGVLEIIDNGTGMSRDQLVNGFMRISTQSKVAEPSSTIYGRQRAGRKGIGRFAAQRLGRRVTIQTQLNGLDESLKLEINWERFSSGADIFMIANKVNAAPKMASPGTTIRIEGLRDAWSNAQIRRAYRYISDLLQPFPLQESKKPSDELTKPDDPGFHVYFYQEEEGDLTEIASDEQNIFSHAVAKISGQVTSGIPHISIESKRHNISIKDQRIEFDSKLKLTTDYTGGAYQSLDGVSFSAHYFITDELPGGTRSMVREILNRAGGIRLYRNGFRVLPYGESFDDWLGLQRSSALRQILPPHHNTNFLGFVEIFDVNGSNFEETASREGLIENTAFSELHDFVYKTLLTGVIEIANARERKIFASDKPRTETQESGEELKNVVEKASALAEKIRNIAEAEYGHSGESRANSDATEKSAVLLALANEVVQIGASSKSVLEEMGMLRVLASLGLTIGEFTHEVRHVLAALKISISDSKGGAHDHTDLNEYIRLLSSYTRYFDQAVSQNSHRKLQVHELRDVIGEFATVMAPTLKRQNIEVITKFEGYDLFTKPMHKSEWASTLLNLFTNSLKAIQRAKVKNGKIQVFSRAVDNELEINFSDNGDGIPETARDRVFEAFFTTSSPASSLASESEQVTGTGLGLKIVRDIIEASNGEIEVIDPPEGFSTCFRIVIPRAEKHEISENEY